MKKTLAITGNAAVIQKLKFILSCKIEEYPVRENREYIAKTIDRAYKIAKNLTDMDPIERVIYCEEQRGRSLQKMRMEAASEDEKLRSAYTFERPIAKQLRKERKAERLTSRKGIRVRPSAKARRGGAA